jgi:ring-1,2-phenylacetyl-CoA epoxidase subunit PaaB
MTQSEWPLWEVFIRSKQGLDHKHVGSLHAADATMAIQSKHVHASNPDDSEAFFDPANDKVYRHPTFYEVPDSIKHM